MTETMTKREIDALIFDVNGQWITDMEIVEADPDHPIVAKTIIGIEECHHSEDMIREMIHEMIDRDDGQGHHIDNRP